MSSGGNRTWRRTLALWAAVVVVCTAVGGISREVEARYQRARSEQVRQNLTAIALHSHVAYGVHYEMQSLEGFEQMFNKGQPLRRLPSPHESVTRVLLPGGAVDPRFEGFAVRLTFAHGSLGRNTLRLASAIPPPVHAGPSPETLALLARLRRAMLVFGAAGAIIALLTLPFARRWRRQVAQVMLACVLVAAVGWAAEPGRDWSFLELRAPLPIGLLVAALLSIAAMLPPVRSNSSATPRCQDCGYDLTGNVSGVCPECGQPTPRGKIERWRGVAERIEHVGEPEEFDEIVMPPAEPA
jgi:hypothetical protein